MKKTAVFPESVPMAAELATRGRRVPVMAPGRRGVRIAIGMAWEPARKSDAVSEAVARLMKSARLYQKLAQFSS